MFLKPPSPRPVFPLYSLSSRASVDERFARALRSGRYACVGRADCGVVQGATRSSEGRTLHNFEYFSELDCGRKVALPQSDPPADAGQRLHCARLHELLRFIALAATERAGAGSIYPHHF